VLRDSLAHEQQTHLAFGLDRHQVQEQFVLHGELQLLLSLLPLLLIHLLDICIVVSFEFVENDLLRSFVDALHYELRVAGDLFEVLLDFAREDLVDQLVVEGLALVHAKYPLQVHVHALNDELRIHFLILLLVVGGVRVVLEAVLVLEEQAEDGVYALDHVRDELGEDVEGVHVPGEVLREQELVVVEHEVSVRDDFVLLVLREHVSYNAIVKIIV
jgi:hypothetical protein